jgi:hypothetical protein
VTTTNRPIPDEAALLRMENELFARIDDAEAIPPAAVRSHQVKPRLHARRRVLVGVLAAAAAVAVGTVAVVQPFGGGGVASAAAAEILNTASQAAALQSDPVLAAGQYTLVETTVVDAAAASVGDNGPMIGWLASTDRQLYIPADHAGEWVLTMSALAPYETFGDESEKQAKLLHDEQLANFPDGELLRAAGGNFYCTPAQYSDTKMAALPRDPKMLLSAVYEMNNGTGGDRKQQVALEEIEDLLWSGIAPADLRAALFSAAALIPGIDITDTATTLNGETGTAIGRIDSSDAVRHDMIIDPETGNFIGAREVALKDQSGIPEGTVIWWSSVTTTIAYQAPTAATTLTSCPG